MAHNSRKSRRRIVLSVVGLFLVTSVFVVRLVDIQVVQAADYNEESKDKRSIAVTTYGSRGDIVDTNGVVIADSVERYDITASPRNSIPTDGTFDVIVDGASVELSRDEVIQKLADITGEKFADIKAALDKDPESDFAYVAKSATLEVRTQIRALRLGWITTQTHPTRTYPLGAVAGNLVGFMGTDGPLAGLEYTAESCVGATNGSETYERSLDYVRLPGSTVTSKPVVDGGTLKLTIDSDFQWFVQQAIADAALEYQAEWATAMVVRVKDGHIMAAADYPSVDPNDVNASDVSSLGSLAFSTPYEPGSTFKAMTAAMLIDAGKINQTTKVSAPSVLITDGGGRIKDVFAHGTMQWTTTGVLVNSSNIGISILSEELSPEKRQAYMKKFGLGERTAVNFSGESPSVMSDASTWDPITEKAVAFGQGVVATSAQVAAIYQTLGNDGVRMPLTLVEGCEMPDGTITDLPSTEGIEVVSKSAANQTVEMLENVVTQGSLSAALTIPGYNIAAKSGTAQVAKDGGGGYGTDRIVSVAGLISGDNPEYAVVVTLGKPKINKTSGAAAPTFKKIMTQIIKTFRVTPSTEPVPDLPVNW
jgi:cell division protein FtsI (penicillin-binding protein 3)